jgi:rRNA maturation endonuclease Nob1
LVEFVYNAHGGTVRNQPIARGPVAIACQGCDADFTLDTYLGRCPQCGGVHAVAPMNPVAENVQFAGTGYTLPEGN